MKKLKIAVDIFMLICILYVSGYHLWEEVFHEWVGALTLVLFVTHNVLNINWYKGLFKGRYNPYRVFHTMVNILLIGMVICLLYSGVVMSNYVFDFLPVKGNFILARKLHILGAYGGIVAIGLHMGLHSNMLISHISPRVKLPATVLLSFISLYGIWVFIKRDFLPNILMKNDFVFLEYGEPTILFYGDYIALLIMWSFVAHYASRGLKSVGGKGA